jgi:uncharacterized protein (TIGR02611 family)
MNPISEVFRWIWRSARRIAVFVVGVTLVAAGVAMLVLPGPGIVVVVAGLAVLATEFVWAEVALDRAKDGAKQVGTAARKGLARATRHK